MMEYAKTAKQTAKKNGINFINNKLVADFSAVYIPHKRMSLKGIPNAENGK